MHTAIDNPNRSAKFYHGGAPGLTPGDMLLPPSVTKTKSAVGRRTRADIKHKYRDDRVYITPDFKFALFFATMHPTGSVYEVEPIGDIDNDPHWEFTRTEETSYKETKQCEKARVVAIVDIPDGMFAEARFLMAPATENKWERTQREARERRQRAAAKRS